MMEARGLRSFAYVSETRSDAVIDLITREIEKKTPVRDIGTKIAENFQEISKGRAQTIARTESLTAVSIGQKAAEQDLRQLFGDDALVKVWLTMQDDDVRDSHKDLQNETKPVDEPFSNGLMYPRDVDADDAGEVINCRCVWLTVPKEDIESLKP